MRRHEVIPRLGCALLWLFSDSCRIAFVIEGIPPTRFPLPLEFQPLGFVAGNFILSAAAQSPLLHTPSCFLCSMVLTLGKRIPFGIRIFFFKVGTFLVAFFVVASLRVCMP